MSDQLDERYLIHANKLNLIANSAMDKVEAGDLLIISLGISFLKVSKNKLGLYTYIIINSDGFTNTVVVDNGLFVGLIVRAFIVLGYREVHFEPKDV